MLTESQLALIDALPAEGGAYYLQDGEKIAYPQEAIDEAARLPLPHKSARRPDYVPTSKKAIILHGAPGSGKSFAGMQRLEALVADNPELAHTFGVISYDEHGAMFDIQEYVAALAQAVPDMQTPETPVEAATLAAREQLWRDFQPLSQCIRSQSLKLALKDELNLYIDTTSSSMGTMKLIELLRNLDYTHIEFWSYHNTLGAAADRIANRLRPTSADDFYKKRVGAYEMLPKIVSAADRVIVSVNASNAMPARELAMFNAGAFSGGHGNLAATLVAQLSLEQRTFCEEYADHFGAAEAHEAGVRMALALDKFEELLAPAIYSRIMGCQIEPRRDLA
jgi:hypothetical protein